MTATPGVDRVIVDTNVLLAATDRSRTRHQAALDFLNEDPRALAVSPQIVREYLAVATRPVDVNGLGQSVGDAVDNLRELLDDIEIIREDTATINGLLTLIRDTPTLGRQVHDANIVAVALAAGAGTIVTHNRRHFTRFEPLIAIESLQ